ncbi:hypothetical protein niasHT_010485 [Heterodera trifolii]|uniref:Uncharacterized protein n=1 Tax=Heterodera trifolii TaxID=157864 RepID=A0ABD2L209_9BILA
MCEAGTKLMETLGNEPNEEAQKNAIEQFKKEFNDEATAKNNCKFHLRTAWHFIYGKNGHISAMMKKMGNCDELKQLLVQDPCEEAKLKVKKVDKMDKIVGKMGKIEIGESSKVNSHKRSIDDDQQRKETK